MCECQGNPLARVTLALGLPYLLVNRALKEDDEQIDRTLSASSKKLRPMKPKAENKEAKSEVKNEKPDISGYRLVDMEVLASVFELIRCRDCGKLSIDHSSGER